MNGMAWVRVLIGAVWLNGAVEKLLNPSFPRQFAASLNAGGFVSQAPAWMQRVGLEWLYRLCTEPRRLWRRYARYNPLFVVGFLRQYGRHRRHG